MSSLKFREIKKRVHDLNMPDIVKAYSKKQQLSLRSMSVHLGVNKNFGAYERKNGEYSISQLLAFSHYLHTNLFEVCSTLLPENLQHTKKETELLQQVADLQKQILDLQKERDWLKEVVARK